jgi:DNA polymerase-3 subunit alpha
MRIKRSSSIWNLHAHSRFSAGDALPDVKDMVKTVVGYGQPALGLTDHGNMAGAVQLYKHCTAAGIKPFPGSELYVVHDRNDTKAKRHHMCVVAYTTEGYKNLVQLSSLTHRNFYNKPILDHADLASLSESGLLKGIAATSGCYFGFIAQAIVNDDPMQAVNLMKSYDKWFDKFYVELQNHNIVHDEAGLWTDDLLAGQLYARAKANGIPAVLTQDSHYCEHDDQEIHDALKRLVSFGPDPDDATFPGDGFGLADTLWFRDHHDDARYAYGAEGLADLLGAHDLAIRELDNYHYNIPFTVDDPDKDLLARCMMALLDMRFPKKQEEERKARLLSELEVIKDTGMAGYLLLVAEVTDWCRKNQVFYQARGSASGSMACWLLRITQYDPLKWNLSFERFISRDRTKPPDIDLDVEHTRRKELIEYLRGRYSVTQIGTWMEYSLHGEDEDDDGAKGSLRVKYYAAKSRAGSPVHSWAEVPEADKAQLHALADIGPFSSYGTHAAGLVITTTQAELANLVPLMKVASSNTVVTQFEMKDVEALGLVKLDVLGLKTLSVLHACMDNLGRDIHKGLDWIPLSDPKTYASIARGDTAGVFQLEGYTAAKGCRRLKPTKIADVIAAMALFRPATMNSGATDDYIARKHGDYDVPVRHEIIARHTRSTFGIMLFQEQVISILRDLGMGADDLTEFLKAVKASNSSIGNAGDVIANYRAQVRDMAIDEGFSKDDWNWLWEAIEGFAAYGFNQAHSTAYGVTAYRCAYLATHHPVEFFAALLKVAEGSTKRKGDKETKEQIYLRNAKERGISIRRADINISMASYTVDARNNAIRKGLGAIKGIGSKTADKIIASRPAEGFENLAEMCRLTKISGSGPYLADGDLQVGTLGKLHEAGALDDLLEER